MIKIYTFFSRHLFVVRVVAGRIARKIKKNDRKFYPEYFRQQERERAQTNGSSRRPDQQSGAAVSSSVGCGAPGQDGGVQGKGFPRESPWRIFFPRHLPRSGRPLCGCSACGTSTSSSSAGSCFTKGKIAEMKTGEGKPWLQLFPFI